MQHSLPPLSALRAFEATARLGSVTAAADELSVTHGAVSRQLKSLDEHFGVALFTKAGRGLVLQVGRNHRQNEWIAFQQARRGDLWFHAQELPGSHVVLKASEGLASDDDLQAAADLAAHFSRGRGNGRVPVVMVPVEGLQRIPGAAAGTVRHRQGEQFWGEPDRALSLLRAQQP